MPFLYFAYMDSFGLRHPSANLQIKLVFLFWV